ncbi:MAG: hypothetical protein EYC70_01090 [Planctomycetota bacterium]|nr:MAG: hypothetical protein EYC70_01090 [Planctomycetota bacterium]
MLAAALLAALQEEAPPQDPLALRLANARAAAGAALAQGKLDLARHEYRSVLRFEPAALDALEGLLRVAERAGDADARLRWTLAHALAGAGADGQAPRLPRLQPVAGAKELEKLLLALPREQAAAARAVLRAAERCNGADDAGLALWHADLAREIAAGCPALLADLEPELEALARRCAPDPQQVVRDVGAEIGHAVSEAKALDLAPDTAAPESGFRNPQRERSAGQAVLLARVLAALSAQARHAKGKGVPPGFDAAMSSAGAALGTALGELRPRLGREYALDAVAAAAPVQRALDNEEVASWEMPAVTRSPRGWYRVETTCGLSALEAAALCVEKHHQRLANWVGEDPFVGRPGLVRLVPRGCDLDAEGAPFWWAGGFQGGDVTTLRFAMGTREGLGRGLTHELTHRFDGALWANCPGWLAEGRACWTGAAYNTEDDTQFIGDYLAAGSFAGTFNLGYGDPGKLRTLLDGSLEEYRDNYTAGTALWSYLYQAKDSDFTPREEEEEEKKKKVRYQPMNVHLYRSRLEQFMRNPAQGGAVAWFERCFADGQDGRPEGLDEFTARFRDFMNAFLEPEPPVWTRRFAAGGSGPAHDPLLYDRMSWPNDHWRCPPAFGEEHAGFAGEILAQRRRALPAIRALEWARSVDGPERRRLEILAAQYQAAEKPAGAFVTRAELRRLLGGSAPAQTGLPASLRTTLGRVADLIGKLEQAASAAEAAGAGETALWLSSRAFRVAAAAGLQTAPRSAEALDAAERETVRACPPPRAFGLDGWVGQLRGEEKSLGPWHGNPGSLVLGFSPEETPATGQVRALPRRPVFVRSPRTLRERYSFRAELEPLTPYVEGELIAGFRGGNRYVSFRFAFGSAGYAAGTSPVEEIRAIQVSYTELRERDGALWGGARDFTLPLPRPRGTDFTATVELLVDGPDAAFYFDGALVGVLHTADGMLIEGFAGFAVSAGALRFLDPLIQEHAGWRGGPRCPCFEAPAPWNPGVASSWSWETLVGRALEGVDAGENGTLVVYVPDDEDDDASDPAERSQQARYEVEAVGEPLPEIPAEFQPRWALFLPQALYDALDAGVLEAAAARHLLVAPHPPHPGYALWIQRTREGRLSPGRELRGRPSSIVIFADAGGIIRAVDNGPDIPRWLKVLRGF